MHFLFLFDLISHRFPGASTTASYIFEMLEVCIPSTFSLGNVKNNSLLKYAYPCHQYALAGKGEEMKA